MMTKILWKDDVHGYSTRYALKEFLDDGKDNVEGRCTWIFDILRFHDDVSKWKHFSRYWSFVRGIQRSPLNSPLKGQWRGALKFSFIRVWTNGWINNRNAGDLGLHHTHYDTERVSFVYIHTYSTCLLNRSFGRRSKKTSKLRVTGLCVGNSPETGEFPAQMASNAENVSIWWRHHYHGCGARCVVFRFYEVLIDQFVKRSICSWNRKKTVTIY